MSTDEASAIDFLVVTEGIEQQIEQMVIDEKCEFLLRGSAPSDHNSIHLKISIENIDQKEVKKIVKWRLNAPVKNWRNFEEELKTRSSACTRIMNETTNLETTYHKWKKEIDDAAFKTIGKTTVKVGKKGNESVIVKSIRTEKREAMKVFEKEKNEEKRRLKEAYVQKQIELKRQIQYEYNNLIDTKFSRMSQGTNGFWKEVKQCKRDPMTEWISLKDENGTRILDPGKQKEVIAAYYTNLYSFDPELEQHLHHEYVKDKTIEYHRNCDRGRHLV